MTKRDVTICFTALFDLTELYLHLAARMTAEYRVVWICPRDREFHRLIDFGIEKSDILLLTEVGLVETNGIEAAEGKFTIAQMYKADRFISNLPFSRAREIMLRVQNSVEDFLINNRVRVVFGEPVNATDMVTVNVCAKLGLTYIYPQTARIPSGKFVFENFITGKLLPTSDERVSLNEFFSQGSILKKPDYFEANDSGRKNDKPLYLIRNIKSIFRAFETSYIKYSVIDRFLDFSLSKLKRIYLKRIFKFQKIDVDERFIFIPLHVQPELSVDVLSPVLNDQAALISKISLCADDGITIAVKPHSNFLEAVPFRQLRSCRALHNVKLVDPNLDSHELIKKSLCTVTFSGTVAYESFFLRTPAIMVCDTFFTSLPNIRRFPSVSKLRQTLVDSISMVNDYDIEGEFGLLIEPYLFTGLFSDPFNFPDVLEEENLEALTLGFNEACARLSDS